MAIMKEMVEHSESFMFTVYYWSYSVQNRNLLTYVFVGISSVDISE